MRLIDADDLMTQIITLCDNNKQLIDEWLFYNIKNEITDAPTVDAEPIRHGHWEKIEIFKSYDCHNTVPIYKCSFCHTPFVNVNLKDRYHYCPGCGAKMDEVEE